MSWLKSCLCNSGTEPWQDKQSKTKKKGGEKQVFKNQSFVTKAQFLSILSYLGLNTKREHLRKTQVLSVCVLRCFSCIQLLVTLWPVAHQASLSMRFSKQYWSGLLFPPPGNLPNPGIEPMSPAFQADSWFFTTEPPGKPQLLSG